VKSMIIGAKRMVLNPPFWPSSVEERRARRYVFCEILNFFSETF